MSTCPTVPDSAMPERVINYSYLLLLLRLGLDKGADPAALIEELRVFDYAEMKQAHRWLTKTMIERFDAKIGKLTVERDLLHRREKAAKKLKAKGAATRDYIAARYRHYCNKRMPEADIPAAIAKDRGLAVGTVENHLRQLRRTRRV